MATRFQVTLDCADPGRLTRFWATALGLRDRGSAGRLRDLERVLAQPRLPEEELDDDRDAADSLVDPDGTGPRIWFQQVPERKVVKNRLHLDLDAGGGRGVPLELRRQRVDAEAGGLTAAGATTLRVLEHEAEGHYAVVMQDPEGNEFCLH